MGTRQTEQALTASGFRCWEMADQLAATRRLGTGNKHAVLHAYPSHARRLGRVAESLAGDPALGGRLSALVTSAGRTAPVLHSVNDELITLAVLLRPTGSDVCTTAYGYATYTVDLPPPLALDGLRKADEQLRHLYPNRHDVPYVRPAAVAGTSVRFLLTLPPLLPHAQAVTAVRTHLGPDVPVLRSGPAYPPVTLGHGRFADLLREIDPAIGWRQYDGHCEAHVFQRAGIPVVIHGPDHTTHTLTAALRRWFLEGGD